MAFLKIVLDTNALLRCVSRRSNFTIVFDRLYEGKYDLCVSTEIVLDYKEMITNVFDSESAKAIVGIFPLLENVKQTDVHFYLNVIKADADENKFVDCAFSANAHYLVTNDKHFNVLKSIEFPSINVITLEEFKEIFLLT